MRRRRIFILLALALLILILLIFTVFKKDEPKGEHEVELFIVPSFAKVTVNDKPVKGKKIFLDSGTYKFKATSEGFRTSEINGKISGGRQFVMVLDPVSDDAKSWAKKNQSQYLKAEEIEGERANEEGEQLADKYPIIRKLPFKTSYYHITYGSSTEHKDSIRIRIDSENALGRQVAVERIRSWGFEPSEYEIIFAGFANPFDPREVQGE